MAKGMPKGVGVPGAVDPDIIRKRFEDTQGLVPPADLQAPPPQIDEQLIRDTLDRAGAIGVARGALGMRSPNWYQVQKGQGSHVVSNPAWDSVEQQAQMPLRIAQMQRQGSVEQQQFHNQAATAKQQYGLQSLGRATELAGQESMAQGAVAQRDWQSHESELDRANKLEVAKALATVRLSKVPDSSASSINKAEEVVNRARQAKVLLHKYGNLGPLLQYGTLPAAAARALHQYTGMPTGIVKDATGRVVPPDELSNDANELQNHITYMTKEAPRALAASGRMDAQSVSKMANTFPSATDTDESGSGKLDWYVRHAHGLINKMDAIHLGAVRDQIYGGGQLPGEEEANAWRAKGMPTNEQEPVAPEALKPQPAPKQQAAPSGAPTNSVKNPGKGKKIIGYQKHPQTGQVRVKYEDGTYGNQ